MAEPRRIAISIAQLVHLSEQVLHRISNFRLAVKDLSPEVPHAEEELDYVRLALNALIVEFERCIVEADLAEEKTQKESLEALFPFLKICHRQVNLLGEQFQNLGEKDGNRSAKRALGFLAEARTERLLRELDENIQIIKVSLNIDAWKYVKPTKNPLVPEATPVEPTNNGDGLANTRSATHVGLESIDSLDQIEPPLVGFNEIR